MVDKLLKQYFYTMYRWYKYFDKEQRTEYGVVASSKTLDVADSKNMAKWKELVSRMFDQSSKEEGKLQYGLEVGRISLAGGHRCEGEKGGRTADTPELATKVLFNHSAPDLLANNNSGN